MLNGLRDTKKQRTRRQIADAAARLFAERGYENVSVLDVARSAEVSEQTVYNYFATKEQLVLDRDDDLRDRLTALIRNRPPGTSPPAAIRGAAVEFVDEVRRLPLAELRGGLGFLAAGSVAVRRLSLSMTDRHAAAIAAAVLATTPGLPRPSAELRGVALAWVFQTITDEVGRRVHAGQSRSRIADEVTEIVTTMLDDLDVWMRPPTAHSAKRSASQEIKP